MSFERCISLCIVRNSIDKYTFDTQRYATHTMQIHEDTTRSSGAQVYFAIPSKYKLHTFTMPGSYKKCCFVYFLWRIESVSLKIRLQYIDDEAWADGVLRRVFRSRMTRVLIVYVIAHVGPCIRLCIACVLSVYLNGVSRIVYLIMYLHAYLGSCIARCVLLSVWRVYWPTY